MEFYLDWGKHKLFGYERDKSRQVIDAIIRGIQASDRFPPVHVRELKPGNYVLVPVTVGEVEDGGHHRAVAHYMAGVPLRCELHFSGEVAGSPIEIPHISLRDDPHIYVQKRRSGFYR